MTKTAESILADIAAALVRIDRIEKAQEPGHVVFTGSCAELEKLFENSKVTLQKTGPGRYSALGFTFQVNELKGAAQEFIHIKKPNFAGIYPK